MSDDFLPKRKYKSGSLIFRKKDVYLTLPHSCLKAKAYGSHLFNNTKHVHFRYSLESLFFELIRDYGQNQGREGLYLQEVV